MKLTIKQAQCLHVWHTELGDDGHLFHYCTRSCGLHIDANPETLLHFKLRVGQLERYGRSMRMAIRRAWRLLYSTIHDRNGRIIDRIPATKHATLNGLIDDLMHSARVAAVEENSELDWAVARWKYEVGSKTLSNHYRRTLDTTWRQVIQRLGGDPVELCGPTHDELLQAANSERRQLPE